MQQFRFHHQQSHINNQIISTNLNLPQQQQNPQFKNYQISSKINAHFPKQTHTFFLVTHRTTHYQQPHNIPQPKASYQQQKQASNQISVKTQKKSETH